MNEVRDLIIETRIKLISNPMNSILLIVLPIHRQSTKGKQKEVDINLEKPLIFFLISIN